MKSQMLWFTAHESSKLPPLRREQPTPKKYPEGKIIQWSFEEVDANFKRIMENIYRTASGTAREYGAPGNLVLGANIAGFRKVADAMIDQGVV